MNERLGDKGKLLLAAVLILALGVVIAGYLLGDGLRRAKMAERSVTVRGLAERDVTADLATWTISYSEEGPELGPVQSAVDEKSRAVRDFFARAGFKPEELSDTGVGVNSYYDTNRGRQSVTVRQRMQLRTGEVMKARAAFARQAELVRAGIALEEGSGIVYSFTRLNAIKPRMIAEGTHSARQSAEQFAKDSGTGVGGIKSATQGYFSIGARDGDVDGEGGSSAGASPFQKVRVVTTIDFYLD
ncbi:MAG TPA: SIMPL domain-containing protein [Allosphingosinicella sp.]|nr:SIMPL domain-containing protein [Allosphingosinicella sp.]